MLLWNVQTCCSVCKPSLHSSSITGLLINWYSRLFLSTDENVSSIGTFDDQFHHETKGNALFATAIVVLPSFAQCLTSSHDNAIKVWNCETGACLNTLAEHISSMIALSVHPNPREHYFASGSTDATVVVWSGETFGPVHRLQFAYRVQSLGCDKEDTVSWIVVYRRHSVQLHHRNSPPNHSCLEAVRYAATCSVLHLPFCIT